MGVYPAKLKLIIFAYTSAILGFAGGFYAQHMRCMSPAMLSFPTLALLIVSLVMGGLDNIYRCCLSTIILTLIAEVLRYSFPMVHMIVLGGLIMVVILITPTKLKKYFQEFLRT